MLKWNYESVCDYSKDGIDHNNNNKNEKHIIVMWIDAIIQPQTMMIKINNTSFTSLTMYCIVSPEDKAGLTVLQNLHLSIFFYYELPFFNTRILNSLFDWKKVFLAGSFLKWSSWIFNLVFGIILLFFCFIQINH